MCTRGLTRVAFLLTFRHIYWRHGAQAVTRRGRARRGRRAAAAAVRDSYLSAALQDIVQLSAPSYQKTSLRAAMTEVPLQTRTANQVVAEASNKFLAPVRELRASHHAAHDEETLSRWRDASGADRNARQQISERQQLEEA